MSKSVVAMAVAAACVVGLMERTAAQSQPRHPGTSTVCGEYLVLIPIVIPTPLPIPVPILFNRPDEGWASVDPLRKRVQATGIAYDVQAAANDTPANHYSHDLDFKILLDPDQEHLLSEANDDGLPVEWETGIKPPEKTGDGANPIFPKWAWPGQNDRVWVDGNWIHDCGHPDENGGVGHRARVLAPQHGQRIFRRVHPAGHQRLASRQDDELADVAGQRQVTAVRCLRACKDFPGLHFEAGFLAIVRVRISVGAMSICGGRGCSLAMCSESRFTET